MKISSWFEVEAMELEETLPWHLDCPLLLPLLLPLQSQQEGDPFHRAIQFEHERCVVETTLCNETSFQQVLLKMSFLVKT